MSAALYEIHADRQPVEQPPRRGRYPRGIVSLENVRMLRRQRAWELEERAKLVAAVAASASQAAELSARMLMTDAALAAEGRSAMAAHIQRLETRANEDRERIADIDRRWRRCEYVMLREVAGDR